MEMLPHWVVTKKEDIIYSNLMSVYPTNILITFELDQSTHISITLNDLLSVNSNTGFLKTFIELFFQDVCKDDMRQDDTCQDDVCQVTSCKHIFIKWITTYSVNDEHYLNLEDKKLLLTRIGSHLTSINILNFYGIPYSEYRLFGYDRVYIEINLDSKKPQRRFKSGDYEVTNYTLYCKYNELKVMLKPESISLRYLTNSNSVDSYDRFIMIVPKSFIQNNFTKNCPRYNDLINWNQIYVGPELIDWPDDYVWYTTLNIDEINKFSTPSQEEIDSISILSHN